MSRKIYGHPIISCYYFDAQPFRHCFSLDMRFGLADGKPHTLAEVALKLNISRERVRQIEEVALKKLRKFVENQEKSV